MRRQIQVYCAAVVLAVLTGSPLLAHHSSSAYDLSKSLTLDAVRLVYSFVEMLAGDLISIRGPAVCAVLP